MCGISLSMLTDDYAAMADSVGQYHKLYVKGSQVGFRLFAKADFFIFFGFFEHTTSLKKDFSTVSKGHFDMNRQNLPNIYLCFDLAHRNTEILVRSRSTGHELRNKTEVCP